MEKVLIALDFNPAAEKVATAGYRVAKALGAEITLVHVIADPAYYAMDYSPIMGYTGQYTAGALEMVDDIKKEVAKFLASAAGHLGDKNIKTAVLEGETQHAILEYAGEIKAGLLVLGTHAHHGLDRIFGVDTAQYVLKHTKVPMLAIPTEE